MSMTDQPLSWKQADDDVYVATRGGEYAGFVEFDGGAHLVRDNHGAEVGSFPDLADARRALEGAEKPVTLRGSVRRRLRRALRRARS